MIDIDKLFEDYFRKFIAENAGKYTEEQLEDKVAEIYGQFGNTPLNALGGLSPLEYFAEMSAEELVGTLKNCVDNGLPVSDFLCETIENAKGVDSFLTEHVNSEESDELATYCVNLLNARGNTDAFGKYLQLILDGKAGESLLELVTETLADNADSVKETVISVYDNADKAKSYLIEILARVSHDDRVFDILADEFKNHKESVALYASYLTKYGDERALGLFEEAIKDEKLSYADFKELKLGIEAFGGECSVKRDFSADKTYKKIKGN